MRRVVENHLDVFGEPRARPRGDSLGGQARRQRFHFDADLEQLADFARRQPPHGRAAVGRLIDQPLSKKAPQRLAHGTAAHRETRDQFTFDQPFARPKPVGENIVAQALDDIGDRVAVGGRARLLPLAPLRHRSRLGHGNNFQLGVSPIH
jgi:hypothetical protein